MLGAGAMRTSLLGAALVSTCGALAIVAACGQTDLGINVSPSQGPGTTARDEPKQRLDAFEETAVAMLREGRDIFRFDTFGSEAFWGGKLRLHETIATKLSPRAALTLGLKVDVEKLDAKTIDAIKSGAVDLDSPATTLALLKADSVIGVKGFFEGDSLTSVGIQCALCHTAVDDSLTAGIGRRLDGWPNRDLDVGRIVASAPTLAPIAEVLRVDEATVRTVLESWGPGKYDAELNLDGRAFRPDKKSGATVIPAAFGLAGVNLHTYTGWGSVTYWNAYVANTQMYALGRFYDPRLSDRARFPVVERTGFDDLRPERDLVTAKLAPLHVYQVAIPAPKAPEGSFDKAAAQRGEALFSGKARCATCHTPPLYTEPGWSMHTAEEMGIDDFQASRSPDAKFYRTTPLKGLFTRLRPGLYHDGRFPDLDAVIAHYERLLRLELTDPERRDLVEFLKSL